MNYYIVHDTNNRVFCNDYVVENRDDGVYRNGEKILHTCGQFEKLPLGGHKIVNDVDYFINENGVVNYCGNKNVIGFYRNAMISRVRDYFLHYKNIYDYTFRVIQLCGSNCIQLYDYVIEYYNGDFYFYFDNKKYTVSLDLILHHSDYKYYYEQMLIQRRGDNILFMCNVIYNYHVIGYFNMIEKKMRTITVIAGTIDTPAMVNLDDYSKRRLLTALLCLRKYKKFAPKLLQLEILKLIIKI